MGVFFWILVSALTLSVHSYADCSEPHQNHHVVLDVSSRSNHKLGKDFFGFDTPWAEFQQGYFRHGAVKDSLINFLKPFGGALYRYPGGNYFLWENSILNATARAPNFTEYLGQPRPDFGVQEYLTFLNSVDGGGIYMLNLLGEKNKPYSAEQVQNSNRALVRWVRAHPQGARIRYWEMGNELDWNPFNYSAAEYTDKMRGTLSVFKREHPTEKLIVIGRTNPWQFGIASETEFNRQAAAAYPFYGIALHAYYDGYPMPMMLSTIKRYAQVKNQLGQPTKVFITEHGRWPSANPKGRWEDNWYQASGSLGAVSAADFTLMSINEPSVATAIWHNLGTSGPWQLIHRNDKTDTLFPSATYWALRTLREAFLDQVIPISPNLNTSAAYSGGYTLRLSAMVDKQKSLSVMGINRGKIPIKLNVMLANKGQFKVTKFNITKLDPAGSDNSSREPNKITMQSMSPNSFVNNQYEFCTPAFSVFSILASY